MEIKEIQLSKLVVDKYNARGGEYMTNKIKNLKSFLEKVSDKNINMLSSDFDANKLNKKQIGLILEVATFLYGKDNFTQKQLEPFMSEANVWFVLEKLRRKGLVKIDDKGVPHRIKTFLYSKFS